MLTPIADDLFGFEQDLRLPGMLLPTRTTVMRLSDGKVLVHSPLAIDDARAKAIEAIGEVSYLVAPSCIHFLFLKAAMDRWPKARVFGAPGLEKKKGMGAVSFERLPAEGAPDAFGGDLVVRRVEGFPYIGEHVFLHPKTRTLVCTDLVFNVHEARGLGAPIFLRLVGAWKELAQSRVWRLLARERAAASRSVADVLAWDFDRIVMGHGSVVEKDGRAQLARALRWLVPERPLLP
jgi:hypothetical protein